MKILSKIVKLWSRPEEKPRLEPRPLPRRVPAVPPVVVLEDSDEDDYRRSAYN